MSTHQRRGSSLFPKSHRMGLRDQGDVEVGVGPVFLQASSARTLGIAFHDAMSQPPICPALPSRLLAREVFAVCPSQRKPFLYCPSL